MVQTEWSRKIDSAGRIILPSKLRAQLQISPGEEYTFFTHTENGKTYLCIECYNLENEIEKAKRVLEEAGFTLTI